MMKRLTAALGVAALATTVGLSASPASAEKSAGTVRLGITPLGAGTWDYQGSDAFTSQSKIFYAGGGDFKVCLSASSIHGSYRLMEEDPFGLDDIVTGYGAVLSVDFPGDFSGGCYVYHGLSGQVDGDNHLAELYLKKWTGGNSTVSAWD